MFMKSGDKFRIARERAGLSQGQVAEYAETAQGYISGIENDKRWPSTWTLLKRLATRYRVSADYLLDIGRNVSLEAQTAGDLIDSLPPEKRPSAVELLRAIIVFAEVGVPLPEEERELVGTRENASTKSALTWEVGAEKRKVRQLGLPDMEDPTQADLDRQLARLKRMVPDDVYDYIIYLTNAGRPLSDADIEFLLKASEHKSLLEEFQAFQNRGSISNG